MQRLSVRVGIRVLERPALEQIADLFAQRLVGLGSRLDRALFGVLGELGQHPHERIRYRLV